MQPFLIRPTPAWKSYLQRVEHLRYDGLAGRTKFEEILKRLLINSSRCRRNFTEAWFWNLK